MRSHARVVSLVSALVAVLLPVVGAACDGSPEGNDPGDDVDGGPPIIQFDAGPLPDPVDGGVIDAGPVNSVVVVNGITPPTGPLLGANRVVFEGNNFDPNCEVTFGGVEATNCLFLTTQRMSCEVPPQTAPGPVDVRAVCALGIGELVAGYTYFSPIELTSVAPSSGSTRGGTNLAFTGVALNTDMVLLIGGRQVVDLVVAADGQSATAKAPPCEAPGVKDILAVDTFGRAILPLSYTCVADLEVDAVVPAVVEAGAVVEVKGAGFTERDNVGTDAEIGAAAAQRDNLINDERLRVVVPVAAGTGAKDVAVVRGSATATLPGGLLVLPPVTGAGLVVSGLVPSTVNAAGADVVTVAGEGLTSVSAVAVDGVSVAFTLVDDRRLTFVAPAHAVGAVDVTVTAGTVVVVDDGLVYRDALRVDALVPAGGAAAGGGSVTVTGSGFVDGVVVEFGGIACNNVVVQSPTSLTCDVPAGAAGNVDVVVRNGADVVVVDDGFLFEASPRVLGSRPSRGGMSGDTFVTITGQGFARAQRLAAATPGRVVGVSFGGSFSDPRELTIVNDSTLTTRTPFGLPGLVDISVVVCDLDAEASLAAGEIVCTPAPDTSVTPAVPLWTATATASFSFFDPTSALGGTRGGPIDGAMYLTALDAATGFPVPNLMVFTGSVGEAGGVPTAVDITNPLGQATLSGPDIVGAQTITVAGDGHEYSTLVDVNASEITLYLMNLGGGGGGGGGQPPPPPPPAQIRGRVFGFAKEFFDPAALGPDELALCVVVTTARDEFSGTPNPGGDNVVFEEGGEFFIANSRPGRLGLVALAGIFNLTTQEFRFRQMGVRREVFPQFGVTLVDQDIELSIPLDRTIDLSLPDAPLDFEIDDVFSRFENGPDITRVLPFVQLGGEGAFAYTTAIGGTRNHALETMPDVPGELLTFIAGSYSTTGLNLLTNAGTANLTQGSIVVSGNGITWDSINAFGEFEAIGKVLVVTLPDGTRFGTDILGVDGATRALRVRDRAPITATGLTYHIGDPGPPSSEVIQDGVGNLRSGVTIQPVLGIPEVISPLDNGALENRTLRWRKAAGEQPLIHGMFVFEPFNFAQVWSLWVDGSRTKVPIPVVPRFEDVQALLPLHEIDFLAEDFVAPDDLFVGGLAWQHEAIFTPGLTYENWSLLDVSTRGRRAWTTNLKIFVHGRDD
jgi:hypothetical protein